MGASAADAASLAKRRTLAVVVTLLASAVVVAVPVVPSAVSHTLLVISAVCGADAGSDTPTLICVQIALIILPTFERLLTLEVQTSFMSMRMSSSIVRNWPFLFQSQADENKDSLNALQYTSRHARGNEKVVPGVFRESSTFVLY